jgi:hypothetical protein
MQETGNATSNRRIPRQRLRLVEYLEDEGEHFEEMELNGEDTPGRGPGEDDGAK